MNELHLFAGAGGGILGGQILRHTCVCAVEIESSCRQMLFARQRDGILSKFPIWNDVCTFDGRPWRGLVDVVCGGFPCQDVSQSGPGTGISGERSGLWTEQARIICEVQPSFAFVENSPMLTARGLGHVLGDLAKMGFYGKWGVYGAVDVGCCHNRYRIWILAFNPNSPRMESLDICKLPCINKKESCRRQFTRAIDAALSEDDYAEMRRNPNDVASGMDRLKAIGNGQVPAVAAYAWCRLMEAITSE